ncbi:MAG TPA: PEP-CTERM sorting domain-containing protein [Candidatus Dormibacteraeota bacterium]|nr:PEP-CTERM sorting domain-containing protein [Candidatus Dormibacteraeota bacterium]
MSPWKAVKSVAGVLALVSLTDYSASSASIFQSGGSGTTYTDVLGDGQGSANLLRDLSSVTISNDAVNLYFTLSINPGGNLANGGSFNYGIGITTGNPSAGGDTSANATTHGNPYTRAISIDSSFGGMTDWIGIFGAGGSGTAGSPFTSYGYNDYAWNTNGTSFTWSKINQLNSGQPLNISSNAITVTVPLNDFASNFALTPGTTFDFDVYSTGTSGNQTAYDSLVVQGPIQGTFNATAQYNGTVLDSYTITAVPEPTTLALAGLGGLALMFARRNTKAS